MNAKQVKTAIRIAKQFSKLYNESELLGIHDNWQTPEVMIKFAGLPSIAGVDEWKVTFRGKWDKENPWQAEIMVDGVRFYGICNATEFEEITGKSLLSHLLETDPVLAELYQEHLNG